MYLTIRQVNRLTLPNLRQSSGESQQPGESHSPQGQCATWWLLSLATGIRVEAVGARVGEVAFLTGLKRSEMVVPGGSFDLQSVVALPADVRQYHLVARVH